jgi:hypothetical protein
MLHPTEPKEKLLKKRMKDKEDFPSRLQRKNESKKMKRIEDIAIGKLVPKSELSEKTIKKYPSIDDRLERMTILL